MTTKLRALKINEVSLVDRPANPAARVLLAKRAVRKDMYGVSRFAEMLSSLAYLMQSSESEAEYEGDNSPVPASLRTWLRSGSEIFRAMAKEEVDELVASLVSKSAKQKREEPGMLAKFIGLFKGHASATAALSESVKSILEDKDAKDKPALIDETIKQFSEHVEEELDKALTAGDAVEPQEDAMSAALAKALGLDPAATEDQIATAVAKLKADGDKIAKLESDLAIAKAGMSAAELAFHDALKSDDERKSFRDLSADQRVAKIKQAADAQIPESVRKQLEEATDLKKRLAALEEDKALAAFSKRAVEIGMPEKAGETLMKASRGDAEAIKKLEEAIKGLTAQVATSKVFEEFGASAGSSATAQEQLEAKAAELRKSEAGKELTKEQAFAKVFKDPANRELVALSKQEHARRIAA